MDLIPVRLKDSLQPLFFSKEELSKSIGFTYLSQYDFIDLSLKPLIEQQALNSHNEEQKALGLHYSQEIMTDYIAPSLVSFVSDEVGYGLFAEANIPERAMIGRYTGMIRENSRLYPFSDYAYSYPIIDEIGRNYVIDAKSGNLTRFINHSTAPNLKPVYAYYEGLYHLLFLAGRPIKKGEQFSYDYGTTYWNIRHHPEHLS